MQQGIWSHDEHDRFLEAIKIYPQRPWRAVAKLVGTRSVRQVQTHALKYHEKIARRMRGMHKDRKTWARIEHRIDQELLDAFLRSRGDGTLLSTGNYSPEASNVAATRSEYLSEDGFHKPLNSGELDVFDASKTDDLEGSLPSIDESLDYLIAYLSIEETSALESNLDV